MGKSGNGTIGITNLSSSRPTTIGLIRLVSCLKGPALTTHRSFSQRARNTYAHCIVALHERYGSRKPALIITLRAELSTVRQEEGESMDTFGDRVYALTNQAYPDLAPALLQSLAVPAFLKGLRDRNAAQKASGTKGHEVPRSQVCPGSSGNNNTHPRRVTHIW